MLKFTEWIESKKYQLAGIILGVLKGNIKDLIKDWDLEIVKKTDDEWIAIVKTKPNKLLTKLEITKFVKLYTKDPDDEGVPYFFLVKDRNNFYVWFSDDNDWMPINNQKEREIVKKAGISKGLKKEQLSFNKKEVEKEFL